MKASVLNVRRQPVRLEADPVRVIARPFIPGGDGRTQSVIDRVLQLNDERVRSLLDGIMNDFSTRHRHITRILQRNFQRVATNGLSDTLSLEQELLIGAYFTAEYSLESVALFNPSIVIHPDQTGIATGETRFILSLRACGEGHISSIVFRSGLIDASNRITIDPTTPFAATQEPVEDKLYDRHPFFLKLIEMGAFNDVADTVLKSIPPHFTLAVLREAIRNKHAELGHMETYRQTADTMLWLARSNYHLRFPADSPISERVIFPVTENESRGIEDARFVRFTHEDGRTVYYATYAAYNGFTVLPQFIETEDFIRFKIITLNGKFAQNKGMALFPRKIDGTYVMISRVDGESLYIMPSDNLHFWNEAEILKVPTYPWEFMQIGNCGSPLETERGWLLLTHGVGPMRTYCLGAVLLDLKDPSRIIAQLDKPLLIPDPNERDGYVPNVVYSCGGMIHNDELILPYAMSDTATGFATVSLDELLDHLKG